MPEPRNRFLLVVLLLICLGAAAWVARPFYEDYRNTRDAELNRFRPSAQALGLLRNENAPAATLTGQYPCVAADVTDAEPQAQLALCGSGTRHSGTVDRFEVDLRYGSFVVRQSDLYINDVFDVPLTRTYNSGDWIHPNRVHAFGRKTNHPYDIAPVGSRFPYTYQMLVLEDGDFVYFPRVSQGTSYSDAVYQQTESAGAFYRAVTSWNGDGWTTLRPDGLSIVFPEAYSAKNSAQGAPVEMRDAAGNRLQMLRDGDRNLQEILTPHKHFIKLQYDEDADITRAEDDQGHWATYAYDALGVLTEAVNSSGHARHYSYQGDFMTSIEDENHHVLLRNTYNQNVVVRQDFGNGEVYSYRYTFAPGGFYAETVSVTLPNGSTTQVEVDSSVSDAVKHPPS